MATDRTEGGSGKQLRPRIELAGQRSGGIGRNLGTGFGPLSAAVVFWLVAWDNCGGVATGVCGEVACAWMWWGAWGGEGGL